MQSSVGRQAVGGWVAPGYEGLRDAFAAGQADDPGGAQLAVYRNGREVAVLQAGPHRSDTLGVTMSCTKGVMSILVQHLVDAGRLDVDAPIARAWPEFAARGKAEVTLRQVLTHSAGLLGFEPGLGVTVQDYPDWSRCTQMLADMTPLWTPGAAYFYHFATWGYLVGEVIRRAELQPVGAVVQACLAGPLGAAFWIGLPAAEEARVVANSPAGAALPADLVRERFSARGVDVDSRLGAATVEMVTTNAGVAAFLNTRAGRAAAIPALNGIGDARGLARIYAAAIGDVDGIRLLTGAAMARLRERQTDGLEPPPTLASLSSGHRQELGLGVELPNAATPMLGEGSFGHAGIGGQMAFAHPESGIAAAYLCSEMQWDGASPDPRWLPWTAALQEIASR